MHTAIQQLLAKITFEQISKYIRVPPFFVNLQILEIAFEGFTECCRHKALSSLRIENSMASNVAVHCDGVSSTLQGRSKTK